MRDRAFLRRIKVPDFRPARNPHRKSAIACAASGPGEPRHTNIKDPGLAGVFIWQQRAPRGLRLSCATPRGDRSQ
jgi:hypothetical protein